MKVSYLVLALAAAAAGQDSNLKFEADQIAGPVSPSERERWIADMRHWRSEFLLRIGYSDAEYRRPELRWTQSSFIQPQMMVEDRYFYDPVARRYTVDRYLDDLEQRYGGIDSVLVWHTYPNIGIDDRNQFDLFRDMPGGLEGVRRMVADFHRRGVRVLFPIMMWDQGTRDEGAGQYQRLAELLRDVGADGVNGDTLSALPLVFRRASDATGHPLAGEPEHLRVDEQLAWNNMNWGSLASVGAPVVSRYKWLEPRHMLHISRRWDRNKNDTLQQVLFNGCGYESWENIWGIWNQIPPRDAEALRRISRLMRTFQDLVISADWEPFVPALQRDVYASRFPGDHETLITFVNRNEFTVDGVQIRLPAKPGRRYYDLWHGVEIQANSAGMEAVLSFAIEPTGYGALLVVDGTPRASLAAFLAQMNRWATVPLASLSNEWKHIPQKMVESAAAPLSGTPAGMIRIPRGEFIFEVSGIEIEGFNWIGLDVQYPWEDSPRRHHRGTRTVGPFWIDKYPVTNAEFQHFVKDRGYKPADEHNFLRDWTGGVPKSGWEKKPVTWVSIEDARAYCAAVGRRLPHEWEWQYAAQGLDGRTYPWGNEWSAPAVPAAVKGRAMGAPDDVGAHPAGASPFGVLDLVGNVWQWTDEYRDEHTRAAILRGGSYYQPQGSHWYFPQAYKLSEHGKLLLIAPGKDRSGAVGFRCAADAP